MKTPNTFQSRTITKTEYGNIYEEYIKFIKISNDNKDSKLEYKFTNSLESNYKFDNF